MQKFVEAFLEHTKIYESPTSFWKWSAYTAIASVLRDNCYLKQGDDYMFPNIYVLILAGSSYDRKGRPVRMCETLVNAVKITKVISGRSSIQAILEELSRGETDKSTGEIRHGGSALFSAQELAAGIVNDPEAINILTDIYDSRAEYVSRLKGSGVFRIKNVCFSMIAASNEDLLKGVYDSKALYGGLIARTFLVKPNEFRPSQDLLNAPDTTESYKNLLSLLTKISKLKGQFQLNEEARAEYQNWYKPFRESYKDNRDKTGILGRIHTSVIKVAMILAANDNILEIRKEHIEQAIEECLKLLPHYSQFMMSSGKSDIADAGAIILQELYDAKDHQVSKKELLRKHWNDFDEELLTKTMTTLESAGMIKMSVNQEGTVLYIMTSKCLETLYKGK